ncbi:MAG: hypothetical protein WDZ72_06500 [Cyclobacteriaceae bacterium]
MKSSLPEADRHDGSDTQSDDCQPPACLPAGSGTFGAGQVMTIKKQL